LLSNSTFEGGIPVVVLWIGGVLILYGIITEKTTIGRHFMTVGGNAESARLSGINNRLVMFFAYLNMAVLTVIAAMIVTVRASAANSTAGEEYELDAIAACIVGGVSAYRRFRYDVGSGRRRHYDRRHQPGHAAYRC
jgi:ABC-type xylose transport system, permease component